MALKADHRFVLRIHWTYDCSIITGFDSDGSEALAETEFHSMIKTIEWTDDGVRMIDQRKLPTVEEYPAVPNLRRSRGSHPRHGCARRSGNRRRCRNGRGARRRRSKARDRANELRADFETITSTLAATRPTAVNLFWAIERMKQTFTRAIKSNSSRATIERLLIDEAKAIYDEDIENNSRMGRFGADFCRSPARS